MTDLEWLTYEQFAPRVGQRFDARTGEQTVALELADAWESTEQGGPGPRGEQRRQFSLVFRGPAEPVLPQATYPLTHPEVGELQLFLVPIGKDADGVRYEAAFA
ncbi:DUF6916 family protein [Nocardioides ferulae]|uniref:DUF6916 family protein n=1 Tax=Nocardioides ferulae TaxID=2340821 RepID=UPI000EACB822|nr:hypothetical protein [Nocardioides ferulae]